MKLITDFKDYYDELFLKTEPDSDLEYNRMLKDNMDRFDTLDFLRKLGYQTISLTSVANAFGMKNVIVYSDPNAHNGEARHKMSLISAQMMYNNRPCTKCFDTDKTFKILQVGYSCYSLEIKNEGLKEKELLRCTYIGQGVPGCTHMKYPMYSIDFVQDDNGKMLACDFDATVKLSHIQNIELYITPVMVVEDLKKFLKNRKSG